MTIKECGTQFDPVYRDGNQESNWLSSLTNITHYINNQFSNETYQNLSIIPHSFATEELHTLYSGTNPYRTLLFNKMLGLSIFFNIRGLFLKTCYTKANFTGYRVEVHINNMINSMRNNTRVNFTRKSGCLP